MGPEGLNFRVLRGNGCVPFPRVCRKEPSALATREQKTERAEVYIPDRAFNLFDSLDVALSFPKSLRISSSTRSVT